ncbi:MULTISPECIES: hypothetical protein [Sphingobacterium]|uniref:hypothetical protein n=1 Tax=Sphingobacterium TaxID=28453 RepID=UPI00257DD095|nr:MULTISPECIES: hypothetical protein [Sphingobacterium]
MNLEKTIENFVNLTLNECEFILLSGSAAVGHFSGMSDIDLIVIDPVCDYFNRYDLEFENIKFQVLYYPLHKINHALWLDYTSSKGHIINLISKSKIIRDKNNILLNLKNRCSKVFFKGPPKSDYHNLKKSCYQLDRSISDLLSSNDLSSKIITATSIYQQLIAIYLIRNNKWLFTDRYVLDLLNQNQQKDLEYITQSLKKGISEGDFGEFIAISDDYLRYANSHPQCSAKGAGVPFFFANYLCIQIKSTDHEATNLCCSTIERKLTNSFGKTFFKILFNEIEGENNPSIIFVCSFEDNGFRWKNFMGDLEWYRDIKPYIYYPIEIDLHPMIIEESLKKCLDHFSIFLYHNINSVNYKISKGDIVGLCKVILEFLLPEESLNEFKEKLFERYFVSAYDTGYLTTKAQLVDSKISLLNRLEREVQYFSTKFVDECLQKGLKSYLNNIFEILKKVPHSSIVFVIYPFYDTFVEEIVDHILNLVLSLFLIKKEHHCFIYYSLKNI